MAYGNLRDRLSGTKIHIILTQNYGKALKKKKYLENFVGKLLKLNI